MRDGGTSSQCRLKVRSREAFECLRGLACGEAVDLCCGVGCSESVVDVDHGYSASAAVEHPEESGEAAEVCAVSDAGGDGDDGATDESGDGAGEGSFHAGDDDENGAALEFFAYSEEAMDSGDADVGDAEDGVAKEVEGDGCFIRDGEVGGAGAHDADEAATFLEGLSFNGDAARGGVPFGVGNAFSDGFEVPFGDTAREDEAVFFDDDGGDVADLFGGFSRAENDFGETATAFTVCIDASETKINEAHARAITPLGKKPTHAAILAAR